MKRWIQMMAVLYPRSWREEFGPEFAALIEDVKPGWRVFMNVLRGAIAMQVTEGTHWMKLAGGMAVVGAILAAGVSFRLTPHYVSSAVISVTPQADPARPTSPEILRQGAADHVVEMENAILSRTELSSIIIDPRLLLYKEELRHKPLEDVIEQMRHDIRIEARPAADGGPLVFSISFSYPDQVKAQATVRALASKFTEESLFMSKVNADAYRGFWGDMIKAGKAQQAPPPPPGEAVRIIAAASPSEEASDSRHIVFPAWGLGMGLALGLLTAYFIRSPRNAWRLAGFAFAGFVLAAALSFLIPNRYSSSGVMMIDPARLTQDPTAALPAVTPATEFLRQMGPQILSFEKLSAIILDPRLNLYATERAKKPLEEVVKNMRDNDLRIAALPQASGAKGAVSAFSITFQYSDRFKAQLAVQALMNAFDEQYLVHMRSMLSQNFVLRQITLRKGGEVLDVLDTATLPASPVSPNRLFIAEIGLVLGLVLGVFRLRRQRSRAPALVTA